MFTISRLILAQSMMGVCCAFAATASLAREPSDVIGASQVFAIGGDYVCNGGTLEFRINSKGEHTGLQVDGNIEINKSTFKVELDDYEPVLGEKREVIFGARSIKGKHHKFELPPLPVGLGWKVVYDDVRKGADLDKDGLYDVFLIVVAKPMPDV